MITVTNSTSAIPTYNEDPIGKIVQLYIPDQGVDQQADPANWMDDLRYNDKGKLDKTINNYRLIIENDPALSGKFRRNDFSKCIEVCGSLPWRKNEHMEEDFTSTDMYGLLWFIENKYGLYSRPCADAALNLVCEFHSYHAVRSYLDQLVWDGQPRIETLFIDYLGATDDLYVRTVSRKSIVAPVARIYQPGIKVDSVLTLSGEQGIGKGTLLRKLGMGWFSDSLTNMGGKEGMEQLGGKWILELGELTAVNNSKLAMVKNFITKQSDSFRPAYRDLVENRPRQCVMFGTTNDRRFLKDPTGDRRFWPVYVGEHPAKDSVFDLDQATVDQIWAEAVEIYKNGERLFLDPVMEKEARQRQKKASLVADRADMIREILDTPVPQDWTSLTKEEQLNYYRQPQGDSESEKAPRLRVCTTEIREIWKLTLDDMKAIDHTEIRQIMDQMSDWEELERKCRVHNYGVVRCYQRKAPMNPAVTA